MDLLILLAGTLLLAACALPLTWALRVRGPAAGLAAALVVAAAEIVLLTIALSLFDSLQPGWMLLGEGIVAVAALGAWHVAGRPRPALSSPLGRWPEAREWARANPAAAGMGAVAVAALALQLIMAVAVAPSNWDSMTYHLARVGYWLQFDSALHFDGGTVRQLANPPNGEFLQAWTIVLSGGDRFANTVQWTALVGLAAAIAGLARVLGFDRTAALFATALFVAMPQPILQATSTQNDLIVSFFIVAALLFGLRGLRDRSNADLALCGAALGLAVGSKGTGLLALPVVAGVLAVAAWRYSTPMRAVLRCAVAMAVGIALLGSFNYALNLDTYDAPLGGLNTLTKRDSPVTDNAIAAVWSFADSSGVAMPWLDVGVRRPLNRVLGELRTPGFTGYTIDSVVQEDTSAYGLLGVLALVLFAIVLLARRTPWDRRLIAGAALGYLVLFAALNEYNPWLARVMMPVIAIGAPLLALLHGRGWTRGTAVALGLLCLLPCLFVNTQKPLFVEPGQATILGLDRIAQQTRVRPEMDGVLRTLASRVAPDAPLGLVGVEDSWDYSFFGKDLERRVVRLDARNATPQTMATENLAGIVFANQEKPPAGMQAEQLAPGYWLVVR
ncbi:MAG TPA: phospholipid carrier-dependent glycosyltransferase [Thermoleophilaceae bacterium]|nr:phospholipid carrier-dependent glycosyltransferase [Thermoleophilaceae bacterium]